MYITQTKATGIAAVRCTTRLSRRLLFSWHEENGSLSCLSTNERSPKKHQRIRILYASQTGTAKMFAQQLADQIKDAFGENNNAQTVSNAGWHQYDNCPSDLIQPDALHIFFASTTGDGSVPTNGRSFHNFLVRDKPRSLIGDLSYSVFGLGNNDIFPDTFNVVGMELDNYLDGLGGNRVLPLALGDDGDCIDSDFKDYTNTLLDFLMLKPSDQTWTVEDSCFKTSHQPTPSVFVDLKTSLQQTESKNIMSYGMTSPWAA